MYTSRPQEDQPVDPENLPGAETQADVPVNANTFGRWAAASGRPSTQPAKSGAQPSRRKLISLIAIGTVGLATAATGISISHAEDIDNWVRRMNGGGQITVQRHQVSGGGGSKTGSKTGNPKRDTDGDKNQNKTGGKDDDKDGDDDRNDDGHQGQPTQQPTQQPPTPQPTQPPTTTGTVIGSASMAVNTSVAFTDPKSGKAAILVRMGNGNFAAATSACTHQGVTVGWDTATQRLLCPAHGATFDPANGFAATLPATTPLTAISVHVSGSSVVTP